MLRILLHLSPSPLHPRQPNPHPKHHILPLYSLKPSPALFPFSPWYTFIIALSLFYVQFFPLLNFANPIFSLCLCLPLCLRVRLRVPASLSLSLSRVSCSVFRIIVPGYRVTPSCVACPQVSHGAQLPCVPNSAVSAVPMPPQAH